MLDILTDELANPKMKSTYFGAMGLSRLGNVIAPSLGGLLLSFYGIENSLSTLYAFFYHNTRCSYINICDKNAKTQSNLDDSTVFT
ncbi:hypothetical protein [Rummeliibacillus suwonensis]|uniref:hypothetical protein n=1 Tax=Rummeliibacillus suwonensis TaxID=1306154 RepID=UPI0028976A1D|nr:hypothetical protein [Rummeliibacillus suwonensis]